MKRVVLLAAALLLLFAAPASAGPSPGAPGIGDRLNLAIGNGGYDVQHYDLDLRYATTAPSQSLDGTVTIVARATQDLSRFNLDFAGGAVGAVSVNGKTARFERQSEELVITPSRYLRKGGEFVVRVSHFIATPTVPGDEPSSTGFFITPDGSATAPQPWFAHFIFPSNDHPRDKASYTFRIDVPAGTTAAANGLPLGKLTHRGRTTWVFLQRQPMATELVQIAVGHYDETVNGRIPGVFSRDVTAPSLTAMMRPILALQPAHMDWMEDRVGRYPFDAYGSLVVDAELGFALETQTLSLYDKLWFTAYTQDTWDPTMVHELSHAWFGNSVSPYEWSDLWLNEGHASWYEFVYAEEKGFLEGDTEGYPDDTGYATLVELMKAVYAHGDEWRAENGPVARPFVGDANTLFHLNAYHGGALVLYALRQKVGNAAFNRIERAYVDRFRDRSVGTDDFIELAAQVSGRRDVVPFLRDWVYGTKTPPMPGHPDWTTNPPCTAQAKAAPPRARRR